MQGSQHTLETQLSLLCDVVIFSYYSYIDVRLRGCRSLQ